MNEPNASSASSGPANPGPSAVPGYPGFPPEGGGPPAGGPPAGGLYYGQPTPDHGPIHTLDPLQLLRLICKKWLTILLVTSFAVGGSIYYLSKTPPVYEASAMIELSVRRPRILNKQEAVIEDISSTRQSDETLNTQIEKFKGRAMIPVVVACYREQNPDDAFTDEELARRLGSGASFRLLRRTRLVQVTVRDRDREFAAKACEAYLAATEASARAENREASNAAVLWLEAQAQPQKRELEAADRALFEARQEWRIDALRGERKTVEDAMLAFNTALSEIENKAALEQKLMDVLSAGKLPSDMPRAAELEVAMERYRAALAELSALQARYTPKHPAVEAQQKALALYRQQVRTALTQIKNTTAANLALYRQQAEILRQKKGEQLKRVSELEGAILQGEMKIAALERTRSAADTSYLGVLSRIQEARLSADENTTTVKLFSEQPAVQQVLPRTMQVLLIGLLSGLLGGFLLAFVSVTLEDRVEGPRDIEQGGGVKILAIVPHVRVKQRADVARTSITHRFGEVAEAFAGLRSVMDSAIYKQASQIILVASSLPEEGKTTTCCNLASAFALNGQKTLLIDFDLRRPRVDGIFPRPSGQPGMVEYLSSPEIAATEITYATDCQNLSIIAARPAGKSRPAELVGQARVAELLAWARTVFDRIIIDAPPLGLVSDALSLAGLADFVLVMARPATSRKHALRHSIQRLVDVGVAKLAVVMNDVEYSKFSSQGYGPYYHYHKHYDSYASTP